MKPTLKEIANSGVQPFLDFIDYAEKQGLTWDMRDPHSCVFQSYIKHSFDQTVSAYTDGLMRPSTAATWLMDESEAEADDMLYSFPTINGYKIRHWMAAVQKEALSISKKMYTPQDIRGCVQAIRDSSHVYGWEG